MSYITGRAQRPVWKCLKILILLIIVAAVVAGYLYLHPQVWRDWAKDTPFEPPASVTKTYKWRDENGNWQISDKPPAGDIEYETLIYSSDVNIVPSINEPEKTD